MEQSPAGSDLGKTRATVFLLITVFINMLGVGLAWPVLPKLIQQMGTGSVSEAAAAYAIIGTVYAVAQFLFSPLIGTLSDRFGRRPVLLVTLAGLGLDYLLTALAPNLVWLAFARLAGGIFGATATTANAYMADVSTPENRARNFGYIGAAFGIGFVLGPLLGGMLGAIDIRLPFYTAAALAALNVAFGLLALPESLKQENRRPVALREINPFAALRRIAAFPALLPLMIALFVTATAQRGLEGTWVLYTDFRFGWGVREAAWSLAFVGALYFLIQGFLVGPVVGWLGEWATVIAGFAVSGLSLALYALADQGWMVYPLIAGYAVGNGFGGPALNAICSRTVDATRQGQLQGALNAINALAIIIGPFLASLVLAHVSSPSPAFELPGAWFILSATAFAAATLTAWRSARVRER
ncbi:MFS transporter [Oricola cellulosilytica]|uniref:MFS transporter n=1 Tax=Oricola cellulosilytica TaxID=1429082 RepID=A0A4R0P5U0_9HYPH|nr:MFS transporter [Oricola cellulosilytica]TCD12284.1 MFS transporter [Oricola cellulosilytica]